MHWTLAVMAANNAGPGKNRRYRSARLSSAAFSGAFVRAGAACDALGLNWIECEFAGFRYLTVNGTDHQPHTGQRTAIAGYLRSYNARAGLNPTWPPGRSSAPGPITGSTLPQAALGVRVGGHRIMSSRRGDPQQLPG
jgi:hypothetical protein